MVLHELWTAFEEFEPIKSWIRSRSINRKQEWHKTNKNQRRIEPKFESRMEKKLAHKMEEK